MKLFKEKEQVSVINNLFIKNFFNPAKAASFLIWLKLIRKLVEVIRDKVFSPSVGFSVLMPVFFPKFTNPLKIKVVAAHGLLPISPYYKKV